MTFYMLQFGEKIFCSMFTKDVLQISSFKYWRIPLTYNWASSLSETRLDLLPQKPLRHSPPLRLSTLDIHQG